MEMKYCLEPNCKKRFIPRHKGHIFCSTKCQSKTSLRQWRKKNPDKTKEYYENNKEEILKKIREKRRTQPQCKEYQKLQLHVS
jgi:hypothetical protein